MGRGCRGHSAHDIPQGRISSGPADRCLCNLPSETSWKGKPRPAPATSSSSLQGSSEGFPTLSELHCIPLSCREPLCSQLQLLSQTERVETICLYLSSVEKKNLKIHPWVSLPPINPEPLIPSPVSVWGRMWPCRAEVLPALAVSQHRGRFPSI